MITRFAVQNFKCLRDVAVELGPFTVLIGANDSGKSSLLDAIHVLGRTAREPLSAIFASDGGSFGEIVWRRKVDRSITFSAKGITTERSFTYEIELGAGPEIRAEQLIAGDDTSLGQGRDAPAAPFRTAGREHTPVLLRDMTAVCSVLQQHSLRPLLEPIVAGFASTTKYRFDPGALRSPAQPMADPWLAPSGDNLAAALDALLTGPDRSAVQGLEAALHEAVPTLSGIALRTIRSGVAFGKTIEFILAGSRPPITIPAANASEGALLLTAFLALAYGDTPEILLIEEPENGLHPTRLQTVIDLLRKISTGAVGNRARQVILTTHSPLLLNYVKPEEVRIFRRDPELGTQITPMTDVPNLDKLLREFTIGELWYLLTEEGLVQGKQP